jgi:hypothetical protein
MCSKFMDKFGLEFILFGFPLIFTLGYVGGMYGLEKLKNSHRIAEIIKKERAIEIFEKSITEKSKFRRINEYVSEIDVEPDGIYDGTVAFIPLRPGVFIYELYEKK